jgi:predicted nucleotidyltransferase
MDKEELQPELPEAVSRPLREFVSLAEKALGPNLISMVLFGSAAEGRLRATSDVNLLVVLGEWNPQGWDGLRDPLRNAHAAIALSPMFVLERELPAALEAFAVKFADIMRRRQVLCGRDPFAGLVVSRAAQIARLRQVLLNLVLRMRERYLTTSLREEQAARVLAQISGPVRAAAATLLELSGKPVASPKAALEALAASLPGQDWASVLGALSSAREGQGLEANLAPVALLRLHDLASAMREQAQALV